MSHIDLVSTAGAHAYLLEAQGLSNDGHLLARDLLEALLGGERDSMDVNTLDGQGKTVPGDSSPGPRPALIMSSAVAGLAQEEHSHICDGRGARPDDL